MTQFIPYGHHEIDDADIQSVVEILRSEWLTTGPVIEVFEEALSRRAGGTPVVSVSSGTAALHAAYAAAGIGPGDEVITPPITFVATQAAAIACGATIVFADVLADTANIDPAAVEAAVTSKTRAIVAVDYAGHPADMDALRGIADRHGVLVIEDAAHSLGSLYRGRPVGSLADITAFSFFPTKNITTAEGGAVAIRDDALRMRARTFARQGLVRDPSMFVLHGEGPWHQEVHEFGLNYRLPDVLAALGLSQLNKLEEFKSLRARVKVQYDQLLAGCAGIDVPAQHEDVDPMWHLYPLQVPEDKRLEVYSSMRAAGIGVQVNYIPAYWHPAFANRGYPRGLCPVAESFYSREISLPMFPSLSNADIDRIVESLVVSIYGGKR